MSVQKILDKLSKMLALANDVAATPGERENARLLAQKIMDEHNLSQEEVLRNVKPGTAGRDKCKMVIVDHKVFGNTDIMTYPICRALMEFCDCTGFSVGGQKKYAFFGLPDDAIMVEYLFNSLQDQIEPQFERYMDTNDYKIDVINGLHKMTIRSSFRKGWEYGLVELLVTMKRERDANTKAKTGTALVVLKNALITEDFKETGIKLHNVPAKKFREPKSDRAFEAGEKAGKGSKLKPDNAEIEHEKKRLK